MTIRDHSQDHNHVHDPNENANADGDPHARRLRGGRISAPFQTYFVTKCVEGRRQILAIPSAAEVVIASLGHARRRGQIKLLAFVVMPDHYHAVFSLLPDQDLSDLMRKIGSYTANRIRRALHLDHPVWQPDGFFDRACRNDKEVYDAVEYVHHNPVRKCLSALPEEWPFSSAHPSHREMLDWDWWV
jgi:putative transposase